MLLRDSPSFLSLAHDVVSSLHLDRENVLFVVRLCNRKGFYYGERTRKLLCVSSNMPL